VDEGGTVYDQADELGLAALRDVLPDGIVRLVSPLL
jgi:hypothetical protein